MGEIIGGILAIYLIGKIIEFVFLKRIIKNQKSMVFLSSFLVFFIILGLWLLKRNETYVFNVGMLISYLLAALILPFIRVFSMNKKTKNQIKNVQ